jgi:cyanophycinase
MIYFSGGKPTRLADVLRDSPLLASIRRAVDRGAVYAGCSAGAMIASRERNAGGRLGTSWLFGLGLIPNVSFGVHWDRAARIPGAQWWMTSRLPDDTWFVGIDERTAILGDGRSWTIYGVGRVTLRGPDVDHTLRVGERFETPRTWTSRPLKPAGTGGRAAPPVSGRRRVPARRSRPCRRRMRR